MWKIMDSEMQTSRPTRREGYEALRDFSMGGFCARSRAGQKRRRNARVTWRKGARVVGELADFCRKLQAVSTQAASYQAPDWVVRNAKAIFPVHAQPRRKRTTPIPASN